MHHLPRCLALIVPLLAGCMADNFVAGNEGLPVFSLRADSAWSGGSVTVTSSRFRELTYVPAFTAEAESLDVTRVGDSSFAVRIPIGPTGPVALALHDGTRHHAVGTVQRVGFEELQWYTPGFDYAMLIQARRHGVPVVLGNTVGGGITLFYPTLRRAERLTGLAAPFAYYGIGQSFRGDEFVLRDSSGAVGVWQLWPAPAKRYTWPMGGTRQATVMSSSTFLSVASHWTQTLDTTTPARGYGPFDTEDCWNVHLSPRGDRAVLRSLASHLGVPIINMLTADTAYTLPGIQQIAAAGFTADGAEFYHIAYGARAHDSLYRRDAMTGQRLNAVVHPDSAHILNLEVDPAGQWVFLMTMRADCRPGILVYEAGTLRLVGDLRAPPWVVSENCGGSGWEGMLIFDTAPDRLFVVFNGDPFPAYQFSVLR